jgi:hypothetical protein
MIVPTGARVSRLGDEYPRRNTGEPDALAREVGLVGVAGAAGEQREPVVHRRALCAIACWTSARKPWKRRIRCSAFGASPTAVRHRRRNCVSEM